MTWSANCVMIYTKVANQNPTLEITETKFYIPVAPLSTQYNAKLLPQLKSGFKRTIELLAQNPNLNRLVETRTFFRHFRMMHEEQAVKHIIF